MSLGLTTSMLICNTTFDVKVEGFRQWGIIICKTALLDFVHHLNYTIAFWKMNSASFFR
jgi:hypothetical protein